MLQIKTTNGNTLIHADQQPDTYNGRSYDGSQYMVHAGEWGRHKYIRKEGNRYIYPEDVLKSTTGIQRHHAQVLSDHRQAKKDKAYVESRERAERFFDETDKEKNKRRTQQLLKAHQNSTKPKGLVGDRYGEYEYRDPEKVELDRKIQKINQKNAARQAEEERKKMGNVEEGSTEELERQKNKTKVRKTASELKDTGTTKNLEAQKKRTAERKEADKQRKSAHSRATARSERYDNYAKKYNKEHGTNLSGDDFYTPYNGLKESMRKKKAERERRRLTGQR